MNTQEPKPPAIIKLDLKLDELFVAKPTVPETMGQVAIGDIWVSPGPDGRKPFAPPDSNHVVGVSGNQPRVVDTKSGKILSNLTVSEKE